MSEVLNRTETLVKKAKSLGANEVIAKTSFSRYRQTRFSNNEVDISVAWNDYVTDVALAWKKRVVATQIRNFEDAEQRIEQLFNLAKVSKENPLYGGVASGRFQYGTPSADREVVNVEHSDYIQAAIQVAEQEAGSSVEAGGTLLASYEDVYLVSSEGPLGQDTRSAVELSIRAFSEREASGHGVSCSPNLKGFDPSAAGRKAGEIAGLARGPRGGEEGVYDIVFDPLFVGSMLGMYAMMSSAFYVMIRMSIFVDKLGEQVASDLVTLRDVPASYSVAHRLFDDEGVPTRENVIIDHGVLKTLLHNTSTARLVGGQTTANAGLVVPMAWNMEMDAGNTSKDDLFREIKRGLYLTNTWYTRFQNYATGDFSTIPRDGAFLIENGEIKQSLKDIRLSDNALNLLKNVAAVSKERQHIRWWEAGLPSLSPYVLIKDVHITKPK